MPPSSPSPIRPGAPSSRGSRPGEATVNELAEPFDISQPAVSKHLKILERAGLVTRSNVGTSRPVRIEAGTDARSRRLAREVPRVLGEELPAARCPARDPADAHQHRQAGQGEEAKEGRRCLSPSPSTRRGDRDIVIVREFDAPRDLVFLCYSKPELLRRWYGLPDWEMTVCDMDFRVGGKWRFVTKSPGGYEMASQGVYTAHRGARAHRPDRTITTTTGPAARHNGGRASPRRTAGPRSITTVTYASPEARAAAVATPMAEGMEIGFKRLDDLLTHEQQR